VKKNNCGKMAHMGTMDTGVTVTDIAVQWSVIPEKKKSNL
jgi:hypothetical protein